MISRGKAAKQAARAERLSAALRENLKRRKAQARGREANQSPSPAKAGQMPPRSGPRPGQKP
jgi:hypothetical protein